MLDGAGLLGTAEDSAIIKVADSRYMIQNTDIFTPIVDDPYTQGEIAACNMTNDLFACGVLDITSVLCFLAAPSTFPGEVMSRMLLGFNDYLQKMGAEISGGHTIINPWVLIGGTATGFVEKKYLVTNKGVEPDDVLILTKPLGTQPAMALHRVLKKPAVIANIRGVLPDADLQDIVEKAIHSMRKSNRPVVEAIRELMEKGEGSFRIHAMTDVTGFGLAGHAENLAVASGVDIELTRVPHINGTLELSDMMGYDMDNARSAETAGGLLIAISTSNQEALEQALESRGISHFVVGVAKEGTGTVTLSPGAEFQPV